MGNTDAGTTKRSFKTFDLFILLVILWSMFFGGFKLLTASFILMIVYSVALGLCMGAATNLMDSFYLRDIGERDMKENGAGIYV